MGENKQMMHLRLETNPNMFHMGNVMSMSYDI
jgi:hypothetical protein